MKQTCGQKVDSLNSQCPPTSVPQQDVLERDSLAPPQAAVDREVWGRKLLNTTNAIILLLNQTFKSVNQACHDNYTVDVSVLLRDFDFFLLLTSISPVVSSLCSPTFWPTWCQKTSQGFPRHHKTVHHENSSFDVWFTDLVVRFIWLRILKYRFHVTALMSEY